MLSNPPEQRRPLWMDYCDLHKDCHWVNMLLGDLSLNCCMLNTEATQSPLLHLIISILFFVIQQCSLILKCLVMVS